MKSNSFSPKQTARTSQKKRPLKKRTTPVRQTFWVAKEESSSLRSGVNELKEIDANTTSYSMNGIKSNKGRPVDQDVVLTLKNLKLRKLGRSYEEMLLTTGRRYKHYKAIEDRIVLRYDRLFQKRYGKTGSVKYYQVLMPEHLVDEVLKFLQGDFSRLLGITKTEMAYKEIYH